MLAAAVRSLSSPAGVPTPAHVFLAPPPVDVQATVNMTPEELEAWLGTNQSRKAVESAGEEADREGRHAARR